MLNRVEGCGNGLTAKLTARCDVLTVVVAHQPTSKKSSARYLSSDIRDRNESCHLFANAMSRGWEQYHFSRQLRLLRADRLANKIDLRPGATIKIVCICRSLPTHLQ